MKTLRSNNVYLTKEQVLEIAKKKIAKVRKEQQFLLKWSDVIGMTEEEKKDFFKTDNVFLRIVKS